MTADERTDAFARELALSPPNQEQVPAILQLAATAAHSSERTAAPVATWLAGVSGRPLAELNEIAARLADPERGAAG